MGWINNYLFNCRWVLLLPLLLIGISSKKLIVTKFSSSDPKIIKFMSSEKYNALHQQFIYHYSVSMSNWKSLISSCNVNAGIVSKLFQLSWELHSCKNLCYNLLFNMDYKNNMYPVCSNQFPTTFLCTVTSELYTNPLCRGPHQCPWWSEPLYLKSAGTSWQCTQLLPVV